MHLHLDQLEHQSFFKHFGLILIYSPECLLYRAADTVDFFLAFRSHSGLPRQNVYFSMF